MTEPAACPFCGSTHTFILPLRQKSSPAGSGFVAACGNCNARIETETEAQALAAWSRRPWPAEGYVPVSMNPHALANGKGGR